MAGGGGADGGGGEYEVGLLTTVPAAVSPVASFGGASSPAQYRGTLHALVSVAKQEGVGALWRGFGLTLGRTCLGTIFLIVYDMF